MIHFRSSQQILNALIERSPYHSITRAMQGEGMVEFLGGFSEIPPQAQPGWIVRVTSIHDRVWLLGVVPDKVRLTFHIYLLKKIPWETWTDPTGDSLYDGDHPDEYAQLRRLANRVS